MTTEEASLFGVHAEVRVPGWICRCDPVHRLDARPGRREALEARAAAAGGADDLPKRSAGGSA
jgi:hypothetical protein